MKNKLKTIIVAALLAVANVASAQQSITSHPAYLPIDEALDLSKIKPEVNVNLPKFLLTEAAAGFDSDTSIGLKDAGINLKELIQDIKLIRVIVVESQPKYASELEEGIKQLRDHLNKNWMPLVIVPDGGVGVYAKSDDTGEKMEGIAAVIGEKGDDTVIINVVGKVPIAKIISLALAQDKLPKDLLKNLGGFAMGQSSSESDIATENESSDAGEGTRSEAAGKGTNTNN